jgi:hypothetical protein
MSPDVIEDGLVKMQSLPLTDQATCVMLAARRCEQQASRWCKLKRASNPMPEFSKCFAKWRAKEVHDEDLEEAASHVDALLPFDIDDQPDPPAAMAFQSLSSVAAIALDLVDAMTDEVVRSGVFFAATSYCEGQHSPLDVDAKHLSQAELQFLSEWWTECCHHFPQLLEE